MMCGIKNPTLRHWSFRLMFARVIFIGSLSLSLISFSMRIVFACFFSEQFAAMPFKEMLYALLWGYRFDLAVSVAFMLPAVVLLYAWIRLSRHRQHGLFWLYPPALLLLCAQVADIMYFDTAGRHVGYEVRELIPQFSSLINTAWGGYSGLLLILCLSAMLFGAVLYQWRWMVGHRHWRTLELPLIVWILLGVLAFRGSFANTPMSPQSVHEIGNVQQAKLALNGAYSTLFGVLKSNQLKPYDFSAMGISDTDQAAEKRALSSRLSAHQGQYQAPLRKMNIVLVMLESWPAVQMHSFNPHAPETTPEFDALRQQALTTDGLLAGGRRTHEGMFSILCSAQNPLGAGVPKTNLEGYNYQCLPHLLRNAGWHVAMFQGSHTDLVGSFSQFLGVEKSYGKLDFSSARLPQNKWGYQDPDLYDFVIAAAKKEENHPFFFIVNTTTTHDLILPPAEAWAFGQQSAEQKYLSVLHYADKALGNFIRQWQQADISPTLFVLVADHTRAIAEPGLAQYLVPFAMFANDGSVPSQHVRGIGSQRDIAPTVMQVLGGRVPWFSGQALQSANQLEGDYFTEGTLGWQQGDRLVEISVHQPNVVHCYSTPYGQLMTQQRDCDQDDRNIQHSALAFTRYSQELLFNGKTGLFGTEAP